LFRDLLRVGNGSAGTFAFSFENFQLLCGLDSVISALHPETPIPVTPNWEPSLSARFRDQMARLGIGSAQVVTFVTYIIVSLGVLIIPLAGLYFWTTSRKVNPDTK
jgi:hypothetical protein